MQQTLHLLIVDRERRSALATICGSRWLLPLVSGSERMRAGPLVLNLLTEHGFHGDVVGQWLGRLASTSEEMEWLMVVDAQRQSRDSMLASTCWTSLRLLQSTPSVLGYQDWALKRALADDLPSVIGPFGSMTWLDDIRAWIDVAAGPLTGSPVCYKATPTEVVLSA